jgi:predicted RNA-binding Zn ribbon-like protein
MEFANTVVATRGKTRDELGSWLTKTGIATEADRFRELRDAIRALLAATTGGGHFAAADLAVVNAASAAAPSWPVLVPAAGVLTVREESARVDGNTEALAELARDAVRLLGDPLRQDLRACQGPGCVQFFVKDHPRREWCGPGCGNRARAARHYRKHRDADD